MSSARFWHTSLCKALCSRCQTAHSRQHSHPCGRGQRVGGKVTGRLAKMFGQPSRRVQQFLLGLVTAATLQRYSGALLCFQTWCLRHRIQFERLPEEEQDWVIAEFILDKREEDEDFPLAVLRDCVAALQKTAPRRRFVTAWKVITGLASRNPPVRAPPFDGNMLAALSTVLLALGQPQVATLLVLCFVGLLRVGEALQLTRDEVQVTPAGLVLLLRSTKTGPHQRVFVQSTQGIRFVQEYLTRFPGRCDDTLFDIGYSRVAYWIRRGARILGHGDIAYRSHSLRRGGATALFLAGVSFENIMMIGRWSQVRSCRLYIQSAEAQLIAQRRSVDPAALARVSLFAKAFPIAWQLTEDMHR